MMLNAFSYFSSVPQASDLPEEGQLRFLLGQDLFMVWRMSMREGRRLSAEGALRLSQKAICHSKETRRCQRQ